MDIGNPRISQPILGRWHLKREAGHGKHGMVYEASDEKGNIAAVKIISLPNDEIREMARDTFGDDEGKLENFVGEIVQRFGVEVETMSLLGNRTDNIIKLYDHEAIQTGSCWDIVIVMEFADTLKSYFAQRGLKVVDVIDFGCDIAKGLEACEQEKIIHRDIKEDNLFIGRRSGIGKLGDFGVSTISSSNLGSTVGIGTPYYMAPEVSGMGEYTYNADIYSLGIVLYKMLNKTLFPFVNSSSLNLSEAYDRRKSGEPLPMPKYARGDLVGLGNIILKCCKFDPSERYSRASELYSDLKEFKNRLSPDVLNKTLPYIYNSAIEDDEDEIPPETEKKQNDDSRTRDIFNHGKDSNDSNDSSETDGEKKMDTVGIMQSIINRDGRNSTVARGFGDLIMILDKMRSGVNVGAHNKKKNGKIIIGIVSVIFLLVAAGVIMYPKTATFYNDESDNHRIHVKYLFFPDRRFGEKSANYISVDGWNLYYSDPTEDHSLYRQSIWGGDAVLLCDADCEYDIVIGDYVYFTDYDEGEILCRIKKDGSGQKQVVLNIACRDLRRNGKDGLMFLTGDSKDLIMLDTTTININ